MKHIGWILDLYQKPGQMIIWLKKKDGQCVRLVDKWKPRLHVGGSAQQLTELSSEPYIQRCRFVEKFETAGDVEKSRVLEVETESDEEATRLANRIQKDHRYYNLRIYDVDIPSPQTYLYEKNLFPLALVEADQSSDKVDWTLKDSRETLDYELPSLKTTSLEIKTRKTRKISTFQDELDSLQVRSDEEVFTIDSGNEADKILDLVDYFRKIDPDIVITQGGDSFIFPYLARRANMSNILDRLVLGRDASPLRVYEVQGHSYFSYGKILYKDTAARLLGRLHVDDHNAFVTSDCGLQGLFEVSRTCIIPIQRASRATIGTNMASLQLYHAYKREVITPWNKNKPEEWKDCEQIVDADRGGFIHGPRTGIHDQVGELDFSSLYPSLMWSKNLSGETVNCKCCSITARQVPELDYQVCDRQAGIVSQSLEILLTRRAGFKRLKLERIDRALYDRIENRSSALKWILVCSFGYLGFKNARFGKIDAHIATCAFSRLVLEKAISHARARGFELVHGIVDSIWLNKPGATTNDYAELCKVLNRIPNIQTSFEGQYKWIVFLNSKTNPESQVLNRYYGVFEDEKLKFRGIDLRRHDTPEIVRNCQSEIFGTFTKAENTCELKSLVPQALDIVGKYASALESGTVPIDQLVITRSLSKKPAEYSHRVPQAVAAKQLKSAGGSVHEGQQVSYVLTTDPSNRKVTTATAPSLVDESTVYDSQRYVDLLFSSAANLLQPLGFDRKSIEVSLVES